MKKWGLILLILLLTLPGYALITIEKKPGTGTLAGHLDDINANDLELDGKIADKVSDDAFTSDWGTVTDVAPSQAALYNYLSNFDTDGDGLFSDEAWFPSIFDPAVPGEIGGTTASAGTFTDLTAETLTLTPTDGENRLTFPENTSRTPATGAEEIFNEGGLMKYSENGVKKNFVTIDDTAGTGDTTVTLSADKIVELILSGGSGVPDGTDTNDILSWDGDSWEPIALEDHPAFSSLLAAFNAAGLNSFTFTPSVTYPIWANTSPVTISFDVTDTSSTYAVADVNYQYDGVGGFIVSMTNTTGDTWTADVTISTDGAHTVQLEAVDDKAGTPNSGQSAVYTINFDDTDPVVGTVTPDPATHDGTGTAVEITIASITEANEASRQYRIYDVTDAAVEEAYQSFTGLTINETLPADQHTYRFDVLVTDLAGNTGTASSADIAYSGGALIEWDAGDTSETQTVLNTFQESPGTVTSTGVDFSGTGHDGTGHAAYVDADATLHHACTDGSSIQLNKGSIKFSFKRKASANTYGVFFQLGTGDSDFSMRYYAGTAQTENIQFRYNGNRLNFPISTFAATGITIDTLYECTLNWDNTVGAEIHTLTINGVTSSGTWATGTSLGAKPTISSPVMYWGVSSGGSYRSMSEFDDISISSEVE